MAEVQKKTYRRLLNIMTIFYFLAAPASIFYFVPAIPIYCVAWGIALTIAIDYNKMDAHDRRTKVGNWYTFIWIVLVQGPVVLLLMAALVLGLFR